MILALGIVLTIVAVASAAFSKQHRPYLFAFGVAFLVLLAYAAAFDWATGGNEFALSGRYFALGGGLIAAEAVVTLSRWSGSRLRLRRLRAA